MNRCLFIVVVIYERVYYSRKGVIHLYRVYLAYKGKHTAEYFPNVKIHNT